jgi:thiol:disulfide interchange protein DsbC
MVFGRLVDLKSMRDLTASKLRDAQGASVASATSSTQSEKYKGPMPISDAITVVRGDGSRVISVFTDPACGYCRQLETQLRRLNNVTIHYYLLPFQGSEAPMAIWCAKDRAAAYAAAMADTVPREAAVACAHPLDRNRLLAATLRIQATPTLLFSDGALVPGVMAVEEIESRLNAGAVKTVTHQGRIHAKPTFE